MQTSTQFDTTKSHSQQVSYRFFFFTSVLVWSLATAIMRLWGHTFFIPDNNFSMGGSFLFSLLLLPSLVYALFNWKKVSNDRRTDAAICLAVPGMLLDAVTTYFFTWVFPNLNPTADGAFGAWLLWGYALVLITGLVMNQSKSKTI